MVTARPALTPGRLYAMMSAEFRETRPRHCIRCVMPMVAFRGEESSVANWTLESGGWRCIPCDQAVARIFAKFAALYDVKDHSGG